MPRLGSCTSPVEESLKNIFAILREGSLLQQCKRCNNVATFVTLACSFTICTDSSSNIISNKMSYKLTYFDIQGVAEKVRLAFVLNGIPFEDDRIKGAQWQEMKPNTKYGQLPELTINGGEPIGQSGAMLR